MSTEQSLDPQLIEQTKQQIRTLVNEIAQLARSDVSPEEFHAEFLTRVVSALAAIGGAIWTLEDQGRLALKFQINLQETKLRDNEEDQIRHGRLLQKVIAGGEEILVPPHSGAGDDSEAANPTDFLLVLGPLKTELETIGVVEVFQRPDAAPTTQKGYLRFLHQMCELAGDFFKSHQLRHFGDRQVLWTQLEEFTRNIHANLDPRDTAYTIANEGRRLIECDRVSVAIKRGNKRCLIEAVSGQDMFDKRSNTVRLLGQLATAVVASGEPVWYTGDTTDMAPQVEDAIQEYVDESHSKTVAVLPLVRPQPELEEEEDLDKREEPELPFGALIVEQIEDSRVPQKMLHRVDVVGQHSASALGNALEHNNLFLLPVWRTLGKARWVLKARTLPKTIAIAAAVVALLLFLTLCPWPFKAHCNGKLQPVLRQNVFAKIDGDVKDVLVEHGLWVKGPSEETGEEGTLLLRLDSTELNLAIAGINGDLDEVREKLRSNDRERNELSGSSQQARVRRAELEGEWREFTAKQKNLLKQRDLYLEKMKNLEVRAPLDGQIVTWDPVELLLNRPVQRSQMVLEIENPQGPWELELLMPEKRMGHIERFRKALKDKDPNDDLKVEFVLATDPDKTFEGIVTEVGERAEVKGDEGSTVLIRVAINKDDILKEIMDAVPSGAEGNEKKRIYLRPGAGVSAKVACGYRSVGYVMLCDAIAYFQKNILFRF